MRLIDANALKKAYCDYCSAVDTDMQTCTGNCDTLRIIDEQPTIEAEPVRHGRWITKDSSTAKCSCCGWWQRTTMYYLPDDIPAFSKCYRFCTSCGARMDENKEG